MKDRLELTEKAIRVQKCKCSSLYKEIVICGITQLQSEYDAEMNKLSRLMLEKQLIEEIIAKDLDYE